MRRSLDPQTTIINMQQMSVWETYILLHYHLNSLNLILNATKPIVGIAIRDYRKEVRMNLIYLPLVQETEIAQKSALHSSNESSEDTMDQLQ